MALFLGKKSCQQLASVCQLCGICTASVSFVHASRLGLPRTKQKASTESNQEKHYFERLCDPLSSQEEVVNELKSNIIYQDEHIVAVNKPNGLPMQSFKHREELATYDAMSASSGLSVSAALPDLARELDTPWLKPIYSQHRLFSGAVVLAKTDRAVNDLQKYFRHTRAQKIFYQKYWALALGIPQPVAGSDVIPVERDNINDYTLSVKPKRFSLKRREDAQQITLSCEYKVLNSFKGSQCRVSLVEVWPTLIKWDAIQLFLLHKLSPVLGDHHYSSRFKKLLDQPVLMEAKSCTPGPQVLPFEVANILDLPTTESGIIPLHIHCAAVVLRKVGTKNQTITITAALPEFFERTIASLSFNNS